MHYRLPMRQRYIRGRTITESLMGIVGGIGKLGLVRTRLSASSGALGAAGPDCLELSGPVTSPMESLLGGQ